MPLELRAILALLYSHSLLRSSCIQFLAATTSILSRSSLMVKLFNHSNVVNIYDRYAHGFYYNAASNREESVYCKRTGKDLQLFCSFVQVMFILFNLQVALFVLWCYGSKFLPTVITIVLSQCISYLTLCPLYKNSESKCLYVYPDSNGEASWGGWGAKPNVILVVQHFALTLLVLHLGKFYP